jgi:hypothetical protein
MRTDRRVAEGVQRQGVNEALYYGLTTTAWGNNPTSVDVTVWDITNPNARVDVTADVLTGGSSVDGNTIQLPRLGGLTAKHKYMMAAGFTDDEGNIWEALIEVWAEE